VSDGVSSRRVAFLAGAAIVLLTTYIYWPAVRFYFLHDDFQWLEGAMVFRPSQLWQLSDRQHFYRPAIELYFALMHQGAQCQAAAFHLASLAVHVTNALIVLAIGTRLGTPVAGLIGATGFAALPAYAEAVVWPSAVTELLSTTAGLVAIWVDLRRTQTPSRVKDVVVPVALGTALACHESAATILATMILLRWAKQSEPLDARALVKSYAPSSAVLVVFLLVTALVNSRNYVITEGHYRAGPHVLWNLLDALVTLYVGHRTMLEYAAVLLVVLVVVWKGDALTRALVGWLLLALAPALPFAWGVSSRYLYMPAVPFSLLLARGLVALTARVEVAMAPPAIAPSWRRRAALAIPCGVALVLLGRFAGFAHKNVLNFTPHFAAPEQVAADVRARARGIPPVVTISADRLEQVDSRIVGALARVALCRPDVDVRIVTDPSPGP
jgi:hypothetical protein